MKILIALFVLVVIAVVIFANSSIFGSSPDKDERKNFLKIANFDSTKEVFRNRDQETMDEMRKNALSWKIVKDWLFSGENRVPTRKLPEVKPDLVEFLKRTDELKVIWFGHSTILLNMDGKIILIDPVFSDTASPFSFMVKRFQPPVLKLEDLPSIDYVLISHDHYDHLDMKAIKFFKDKETKFVVPLGVDSHLISWGVDEKKITKKAWWQSAVFDDLEFIATPAQHFSGRGAFDTNKTLWASWVVKSKNHNIFFSGDSGYDVHFKEIGDKYGPFDLAFIESGQYNAAWKMVHLLPEQAVSVYQDLRVKRYFPIHWAMFKLSLHPWDEPVLKLSEYREAAGMNLVVPQLGELYIMNDGYKIDQWWTQVTDRE